LETEHHFAKLKPRAAAMAFDLLLIFAYIGMLFIVGWILKLTSLVEQRLISAITRDFVAFIVLIFPVVLYFSLQESSIRQTTIGKQKMGLQVINANGGRLSTIQSFLRSGLKFLPWQMAHTSVSQLTSGNESPIILAISILAQGLVIINLLILMIDKRHRTLYGWLSGTSVVEK
jgi:uncharacterized RDD family membrane protein YckC